MHAANADSTLRAIVLTGAGRKAFCAGADLSRGTDVFTEGGDETTTDFGRLARVVRDIGIPLIARVNGDCVAGGVGLMAMADLAIVADHCALRPAGSEGRCLSHAGAGLPAAHAFIRAM